MSIGTKIRSSRRRTAVGRWAAEARRTMERRESLRARLTRGVGWSLVGSVVAQACTLAGSVIVARRLGQVSFGEYGIVSSTMGTFGGLASAALGSTAAKYVAEYRTTDPERAGRIVGLSLRIAVWSAAIMALLLFLVCPLLARRMLAAPSLVRELQLGCGLVFFSAVSSVQLGVLVGLEAFRATAQIYLLRGLLGLAAMAAGAWWFGLTGVVGATVLVAAATWVASHGVLQRECRRAQLPVSHQGFWAERRVLWQFSLPSLLAGVVTSLAMWAANALLVRQINGYAEMGVVNAANQWRTALAFLPGIVAQAAFPILANLHGEGQYRRFLQVLQANLVATTAMSLVTAAPIVLAARSIMAAYGTGFSQGQAVLLLIIAATVVSSIIGVIGTAITSMGKLWHGFLLNCGWMATFGLLTVSLISKGALGLALAYLLSAMVHLTTVGTYVYFAMRRETA